MFDYIAIVLVITAPVDSPIPIKYNTYNSIFVHMAAMNLDLAPQQKVGDYDVNDLCFSNIIAGLRVIYHETKDCPRSEEVRRFWFAGAAASDKVTENQRLADWWKNRFDDQQINMEFDRLCSSWVKLRDAWGTSSWNTLDCRLHLRDLKNDLGEDAWNEGKMPLHIPLWRYKELD